ncbi:MAG: hypothetical protein Q7T57_06685 [Dehalococcoidales bacterium]|nr:hypothetical protein [Dehalococcoidales bacterium]
MTIDKAIKNLKAGRRDCGMIPLGEFTSTMDLAIEALKRVKDMRVSPCTTADEILPGETEE